MKLRTFATATTLLGAALISYGQDQNAQRPGGAGATATEQEPGGAAGQPGSTSQPRTTGQAGASIQPDTAGQAGASVQPGTAAEPPAGQEAASAEALERAEEERSERVERAETMRTTLWEDAEESQVQLTELPDRARDTLISLASDATLAEQVTRLSKDGQEVFRATVTREGEEEMHILIQEDGTVTQTKQKVEFSDLPAEVQKGIREQMQGGADTTPRELHRVIAGTETTYVASTGGPGEAATIRVDNEGKAIKKQDLYQDDGNKPTVRDARGETEAGARPGVTGSAVDKQTTPNRNSQQGASGQRPQGQPGATEPNPQGRTNNGGAEQDY